MPFGRIIQLYSWPAILAHYPAYTSSLYAVKYSTY
nr:MAG TPA: hypothetical protein [Caudoviricetes sp.]